MHALQPMQMLLSKSTMPSSRRNMARVGQAATHGASAHWFAPGHLEGAADLRERPDVHGFDVGPW